MWRKRRGSYGGGNTRPNATESPNVLNSNSLTMPSPGPLGLDLRARHIERDKPQRGAVVKGFRPLNGGKKGYVESTGRVKVGDVLQVIHKTPIDDMPFEQIVKHAMQLQRDPDAWPLSMEFRRESEKQESHNATPSKPRRNSFFRSSISMSNAVPDGNFNEKLQYFRDFFSTRIPTGGAAPKEKKEKPPKVPRAETVDEMYRDLMLKRGVPEDVMDELIRIESLETKWHVVWYAQQNENEDNTKSNAVQAEKFAENLVELKWDNKGLKDLGALRSKIAIASTDWLEAFLAHFGLDYLTMKLPDPSPFPIEQSKYEKATRVCEVILRILRSLTHFTAGVEAITNTPGLVKRVALCFHTENGDVKKYTLQLLGIVCYNSAAGHTAVIEAFGHYKETKGESIRFSCLRDALKSTRYSLVFKEDVLSFVNIIVNKAIRLEDRLAIRSDFMALKMAGYFEEIRAKSIALDNMEKQIDVFEQFMEDDRKDTIYEQTDLASVESVFQSLFDSITNDSELQITLLAPVEEVRNYELGYDDRKTLLKMRDRYAQFLQKCADEDPTFQFRMGPIILIDNKDRDDDLALSDTTAEETDEEDTHLSQVVAHEHPELLKYFKLLKMGMPIQHVQLKMSSEVQTFDPSILETPDKVIHLSKLEGEGQPKGTRAEEHEKYVKFFKLKKMGMSLPHIQLKMSAEGLDGSILETPDLLLDEDGNEVKASEGTGFAGIPVKEHEKFAKFFKLLKMGMPLEHVQLKVSSEGLDGSLLNTPDQLLDEEGKVFVAGQGGQTPQGIPVKDHEKFAKFFKLMKMGMPLEQIKLKASAEGLDGELLSTPDALLNEDGSKFSESAGAGVPVKEHEKFIKFFKLMKMGMPIEHVKLKVSAEGLDGELLSTPDVLVDEEGKKVEGASSGKARGTPVKDHEKFAKFFKLLKMGMPMEHVKLKVSAEGLDANLLENPDKLVDGDGKEVVDDAPMVKGVPVKDHEKFAKFFKLMKMGMPMPHIKLKVASEGLDGDLLDTPDKLVDENGKEIKAGGGKTVKASEHPSYIKYFKLLKMGMPRSQLELKMTAESLDPKVLDTPDVMIPENLSEAAPKVQAKPVVTGPPKPKLRNLYWEAVKSEDTTGTIWESFAKGDEEKKPKPAAPTKDAVLNKFMDQLSDIFVNKPAKAKETETKKPAKRRAPTRVALIDAKRANNIGIMLARFRLPYYKLRNAVLLVDKKLLSVERVSALLQFAPEQEELDAVQGYSGDPKLLGDAEQYYLEMLCVPRLTTRLQAIHATWQFDTYVDEQQKLMDSVSNACRELQECAAMKEIFRVVLSLGNALNDGTARGGAKGFRLNILLKLNQVKASDNSTNLLNYLAMVLRAKDPAILEFDKSLPSIESASRVTTQVLRAGESAVRKAATLICNELETHAKLPEKEYPQPDAVANIEDEPEKISDRFQDVVKPFADRAKKTSEQIAADLNDMTKRFEETASFYGEDPSSPDCGPDAFFSIFYSFAKVLQSADRDNERKRIAEERRVRREEETKKRLEQLKLKKKKSGFATLKTGDVDDIVSKIRAKRVEEKRRELLANGGAPPSSTSSSRGSMNRGESQRSSSSNAASSAELTPAIKGV
ncbi:hypothetical protein BBJ29_005488 [Phytophthora kernoviae]|uniref:FH2 domain-containing protein n=1 Tax=Phytophthora kernoviae TaxID=325452 RepID=A0A3F2RJQ0_9STRA|nr:hypothetical protein BBP00_00006921 [Phytophthora kernoviae]RLN60351.1 hypothetical protein BBJ29_005488 [Phytophthora kernoviae]